MGIALLSTPEAAADWCAAALARGATLGFVPTMGALHEGHLSLVRRAGAENELVFASVFVNPLQFNDPRDFARYPRTLERDAELLEGARCAMVFTGSLAGFFPGKVRADGNLDEALLVDPGPAAQGLEGEFRPGHFVGVATIVACLFRLTRPTRAYFGQKDYQQTLVVRDLARRVGWPDIVVCPTLRAADGLALSSRNVHLSSQERGEALAIVRALRAARSAFLEGEHRPAELTRLMRAVLARSRLQVEYAEVRDRAHWSAQAPPGKLEQAVALIAARAGPVRLIDCMELDQGAEASP